MAEAKLVVTILAANDLDRTVKFYDDVFGFPRRIEAPVFIEFELPGGAGLGFYKKDSWAFFTTKTPIVPGGDEVVGTELYFHVDDLEAVSARIEAAGGTLLSEAAQRPWGDVAAYFRDPDGNVIAVARNLGSI